MSADFDAALVIGIAHYPWLRPLEGPVTDANRIAAWLCGTGGLPAVNVELVVSRETVPGHPILDEIDAAIDRILERAESWSQPRRLYVYFAGHGCSREIDHLALLMANAKEKRLERAMNAGEYRKGLAQYLFPEQVYLFDCCRSYDGVVTGRGPDFTVSPAVAPVDNLTQFVMYATQFTEAAYERHLIWNERRGLFTEALIEGLSGGAATLDHVTGEGIVTNELLTPYVKDRLNELAKRYGLSQRLSQTIHGNPRHLVLATGVDPWRRRLKVRLPPGSTRLLVQDERGGVVVDQPVSGAASAYVDLEMTVYTVTAQPSGTQATIRVLPDTPAGLGLGE